MAAKKTTTKKTKKKSPAPQVEAETPGQMSVADVPPEQLVNAVGDVFNYLSSQSVPGTMEATNAHNKALQSLFVVQQGMIHHFDLDQEQLNQGDGETPPVQ